jgi:alpha-tubulin suppressor-like RCC1 family protein
MMLCGGLGWIPSGSRAAAQPSQRLPATVAIWGTSVFPDIPPGTRFTAIAAGRGFAVALTSNGAVLGWGSVFNGNPATIPDEAQSGVKALAAGAHHVVILKQDGSVVSWGDNSCGQTEVPPAGQSGVTAIAAGACHSLALKSDGRVISWGAGDDLTTVPAAARSGVAAIAAGSHFNLALKADGSVISWGILPNGLGAPPGSGVTAISACGELWVCLKSDGAITPFPSNLNPVPNGIVSVAAGDDHYLALTGDGSVVSWALRYPEIRFLAVPEAAKSGVVAVSACTGRSMALKNDGSIVAWSVNGSNQSAYYSGLNGVVALAGGYGQAVVLSSNGAASTWGEVWDGVGGDVWDGRYPQPVRVPSDLGKAKAISSGVYHVVALEIGGSVKAFGLNSNGQTIVPKGLGEVAAVSAGALHTVALKVDGSVAAWGWNRDGQCTGTPTGYPHIGTANPVSLGGRILDGVTAVAGGGAHTLALRQDGSVVAWGNGAYGQSTVPTAARSGVVAIAAGGKHSIALKDDGTVLAWGDNTAGQSSVPSNLKGVKSIAAGASHSVALTGDGSIMVWGGSKLSQSVPTVASTDAISIAAGGNDTLALVGSIPPQPHPLDVKRIGQALVLSWPAGASGFKLESASRVDLALWDTVSTRAVVSASSGQFGVTLVPTESSMYFRLRE